MADRLRRLRDLLKDRLEADDWEMVWQEHQQLLNEKLDNPRALSAITFEQLHDKAGLSAGAAAILKDAFPESTGAGAMHQERYVQHVLPSERTNKRWGPEQVAQELLAKLGSQLRDHKSALAPRQQPIEAPGELLHNPGQYFALAGMGPALNNLARFVMRSHTAYQSGMSDELFLLSPQMATTQGGPGLGKSTYTSLAWTLLDKHMRNVAATQPERWARWQADGADGVLQLLHSWSAEVHDKGPFVYVLNMSLQELHEDPDDSLSFECQVAARMLWATQPTGSSFPTFMERLHAQLPHPALRSLTPFAVQWYVQLAAGLPLRQCSMVVFVFDECNAVVLGNSHASSSQQPTFLQQYLHQAVGSRVAARKDRHMLNSMLLLVAASTRSSGFSLLPTPSRKAGTWDLRLPLLGGGEEQQLLVMDLLRRLPPQRLPAPLRHLGALRDAGPLEALTEEQRQQLQQACPGRVAEVLQWTSNPRATEAALGVLTGRWGAESFALDMGNLAQLCHPTTPIDKQLSSLVDVMLDAGWRRWLSGHGWSGRCLLALLTHAVLNLPVTRNTLLTPEVYLSTLEGDGMAVLVRADGQPDMRILLPPLLLVSLLQYHSATASCDTLTCAHLSVRLAQQWRLREYDDLNCLVLRLMLWRAYMRSSLMPSEALLPPLQSFAKQLLVPDSFVGVPLQHREKFSAEAMRALVTAFTFPQRYQEAHGGEQPPWAVVFGGSNHGPDAAMLLRAADEDGNAQQTLVLYLQSKLRTNASTVSWEAVQREASKVPVLRSVADSDGAAVDVLQLFLSVSDQEPRMHKRSAGSLQPDMSSAQQLQQLACGEPVLDERGMAIAAVFGSTQWHLRGAVSAVKALLECIGAAERATATATVVAVRAAASPAVAALGCRH